VVAALVFALVTSDLWRLADALGLLKLSSLTVSSLTALVTFLIAAHGLWSRTAAGGVGPEQAILFNVAISLTLTIGVISLYGALFVLGLAGAGLALASRATPRCGKPPTATDPSTRPSGPRGPRRAPTRRVPPRRA
jgi:hypothetical protein